MKPCHHYPLAMVDGACSDNGRLGAIAGIGGTIALNSGWSEIVDEQMDGGAPRTSQRAELLAALEGLAVLTGPYNNDESNSCDDHRRRHSGKPVEMVIATDSQYVAKGITEWFPTWKNNGWRTSANKRPVNLDLFSQLDQAIYEQELEGNKVGLWWIERRHNGTADEFAKDAVRRATAQIENSRVEYDSDSDSSDYY